MDTFGYFIYWHLFTEYPIKLNVKILIGHELMTRKTMLYTAWLEVSLISVIYIRLLRLKRVNHLVHEYVT